MRAVAQESGLPLKAICLQPSDLNMAAKTLPIFQKKFIKL
jgi:hypothetical protein